MKAVCLVFPKPFGEVDEETQDVVIELMSSDDWHLNVTYCDNRKIDSAGMELLAESDLVICFGKSVFEALVEEGVGIGKSSDFSNFLNTNYDYEGRRYLFTYDPKIHTAPGTYQKDLTRTWIALLLRTKTFFEGEEAGKDLVGLDAVFDDWTILGADGEDHDSVVNSAYLWLKKNPSPDVSFDIENAINKNNPLKFSIYQKDSRILCFSMTAETGQFKHPTLTVWCALWDSTTWHRFIRRLSEVTKRNGTDLIYSNHQYDIACCCVASNITPEKRIGSGQSYAQITKNVFKYFQNHNDSHVLFYCLDQGDTSSTGLKQLTQTYLGAPDWSSMFWSGINWIKSPKAKKMREPNFDLSDLKSKRFALPDGIYPIPSIYDLLVYSARDAYYQCILWTKVCKPTIEANPWVERPYRLVRDISLDLVVMTWYGIPYNVELSAVVRKKVEEEIEQFQVVIDQEVFRYGLPVPFNVKSPDQKAALIERLGLGDIITERTEKTKKPSLTKHNIYRLFDHEIHGELFKTMGEMIQSLDLISKVIDTYEAGSVNGRFHAPYYVTRRPKESEDDKSGGTVSGRASSVAHIFPKKNKRACSLIRACPGRDLVIADFKSIEPVVLASICNCKKLLELFDYGKKNPGDPSGDLYRVVWSDVQTLLGKKMSPGDVDESLRDMSKVLWLAYTYDRSVWAMAEALGCSEKDAARICAAMSEAYPEILEFTHRNRMATISGNSPRTVLDRFQGFYLKSVPRENLDVSLPPMTLDQLSKTLAEIDVSLSQTDAEALRSMGNNQIQSVANDVSFYFNIWASKNCPVGWSKWAQVHDSLMFEGVVCKESLSWLYDSMRRPDLWMPNWAIKALNWDKYDVVQGDVSWGPTRWQGKGNEKGDHQKWIPTKTLI